MVSDSRRLLSSEQPRSVSQPRSPFSCQPSFGELAASAARLGQTRYEYAIICRNMNFSEYMSAELTTGVAL